MCCIKMILNYNELSAIRRTFLRYPGNYPRGKLRHPLGLGFGLELGLVLRLDGILPRGELS